MNAFFWLGIGMGIPPFGHLFKPWGVEAQVFGLGIQIVGIFFIVGHKWVGKKFNQRSKR